MTAYLVRRLITAAIVVLGVTVITFVLLHIVSPSPGRVVLGLRASLQAVATWNRQHGYDSPIWVQYWHYLDQNLHGNLGFSYKLNESVNTLFAQNAGRSALLSGSALVLALVVAIPLGIFQAVKRNTPGDYVLTSGAFITYSMPTFFLGLILIEIFALDLNWLPSEASQSQSVLGVIQQANWMILPVVTLAAVQVASFSRYMRSSAIDTLAQDYIRVAKAKGLSQRMILTRHLLRNACLPIVTLVGLSIPSLLAGNLITENVFNYKGMGVLFFNSLSNEDYPVLLAYSLVAGVLTVIGNLVADVSLGLADPRIRLK